MIKSTLSRKTIVMGVIFLFVGMSTILPITGGEVKKQCLTYGGIFSMDSVEKLESEMLGNSSITKKVASFNNSLPDLEFIELRAWWGLLNTTGIFVDYDVNNSGDTYYSDGSIVSNLSFFADGNTTSFGYILQSPMFYPSIWYPGEILGGCNFFEMDKIPDTITVKIDFTNSIPESNETNNNLTVSVVLGVTISGSIYKCENGEMIPYEGMIELNQYDEDSLSDFGHRHYWADENGRYNMSLCPKEPLDETHIYSIMACVLNENLGMMKESSPVKAGENTTLNFLFEGFPPNKPNMPFGRRFGRVNTTYTFFSSNIDPDEDNLFYKFRWGDGSYSDWLGPYPSGGKIWASHEWSKPERYSIGVISKDSHGILSKWSDFAHISVNEYFLEYKHLPNSLFFRFLENIIGYFPFLQHRLSTSPGNIIPNNGIVSTLYVGGPGSGNYSSIQNAINNATAGDTVFVYDDSSPYSENIVINKSITLVGEDKNTTIIDGSGVGDVILISADQTNITGFTIRNGGSSRSGISLADYSDYNVITNNIIISNKWDGISLHHSSNNTISYNIFSDNSDGIYLSYLCNHNNILGNVFLDNMFYGIYIQSSNRDNVIYFNNLIGNGQNAHDESNNIWDDGWNGNYWDDYEERYSHARRIWLKGIWSIPYNIPGGDTQDRYPLFKPYARSDIKIKDYNMYRLSVDKI